MRVRKMLDDIEQSPAYQMMPREIRPDRRMLLQWMSAELNELVSKTPNFDFWIVQLEPAIRTREGAREYDLPEDFGLNFVRLDTDKWACNLDDGNNETNLPYKPLKDFYAMNLTAESNAKPSCYTIKTRPDGRRLLVVSPPPDSNSSTYYEIDGLYARNDWELKDEDVLPPVPGQFAILKYAVMRRISTDFEQKYIEAYAVLMNEMARNRDLQLKPSFGSGRNEYMMMRQP